MKKKSLLVLAIVAMFAFAGCSGEKGKTVGTTTGTPSETQGVSGEKEKPTVTMTPEQKELAGHLRTAHGDEVSAQLVEQGYYHEVNQSSTDGIFQIDFKAVTGDLREPMLVFDVYVNDAELAAEYEEIKLHAYILGEDAYANERDSYMPWEGVGKADELQDNLYHVTMPGTYIWMTTGDSFVVDACQVDFVKAGRTQLSYPVNVPETRLTILQSKFHPVLELGYVGFTFTHGGREYTLNNAEYGQYNTKLIFTCFVDRNTIYTDMDYTEQIDDNFQLIWKDFLSNVELEVDGKSYYVDDNNYMTFSENGGTEEQYRGRGSAYTPGVDFAWAKEAKIWVGTTGYDLKSGSKTPLTRELPTPTPAPAMKTEQAELAEYLRSKCKDEISADLVEKGYYHLVNETREEDIFRFDFKALTGDEENLMMVFDVYVEDPVLTEMYPVICMGVDCEREENYEPGNWWNCDGYGVQDPENKKLYHVIISGYIFGYAPTVAEICQVGFDVDTDSTNGELVYEVGPEPYYVDVPLDTFAPVLRGTYSGMEFSCGGRSYELTGAFYESYYVDFEIRTAIDSAEVPTDDLGLEEYREELQKEWAEVWPNLTLVADGKEYKVVDEDGKRGYLWFIVEEGKTSYQGYVHAYFPAVDYFKVSELELKVGDAVYNLK